MSLFFSFQVAMAEVNCVNGRREDSKYRNWVLVSEVLKVLGHEAKVLAKILEVCHGGLECLFDSVDFGHGDSRIFTDVVDQVHAGKRSDAE